MRGPEHSEEHSISIFEQISSFINNIHENNLDNIKGTFNKSISDLLLDEKTLEQINNIANIGSILKQCDRFNEKMSKMSDNPSVQQLQLKKSTKELRSIIDSCLSVADIYIDSGKDKKIQEQLTKIKKKMKDPDSKKELEKLWHFAKIPIIGLMIYVGAYLYIKFCKPSLTKMKSKVARQIAKRYGKSMHLFNQNIKKNPVKFEVNPETAPDLKKILDDYQSKAFKAFQKESREVLGIDDNDLTEKTIKKAYLKKALKNHPDRGGDAEMFKKVGNANEVLKDLEQKNIQPTGRKKIDTKAHLSDEEKVHKHDFNLAADTRALMMNVETLLSAHRRLSNN